MGAASMGPRPSGRGDGGPTDAVRGHTGGASMGPRPSGRGDVLNEDSFPLLAGKLQWGRGRQAAVMAIRLRGDVPGEQPASMGPRPSGRGDVYLGTTKSSGSEASM